MDVEMSMFRRTAVVGPAVVLAAVLAGCASGQSVDSSPGEQGSQEPSEQAGSQISNPKDPSQLELCQLLPKDAATSMGLDPQGTEQDGGPWESVPPACMWREAGSGEPRLDLSVATDRSIQSYYSQARNYTEFEKLTVAGHPAVKANNGQSMSDGTCNVFVGTKDGQIASAQTTLAQEDIGKVDPCGMAKQALEKSIPTWPSAK